MSGQPSAPYDIGRSSGQCAATGAALVPGEFAVAALIENESDGALSRLDYSISAWESSARPDRLFCFWRRRIPEPNVKPKPFIDDKELLALFERLAEAEGDRGLAFRFVLALLLIRNRLLRQVGSSKKGDRHALLVIPKGAGGEIPPIEVIDPGMTPQAIDAVTEEFERVLRGEA